MTTTEGAHDMAIQYSSSSSSSTVRGDMGLVAMADWTQSYHLCISGQVYHKGMYCSSN
jgi:hypothetical protein